MKKTLSHLMSHWITFIGENTSNFSGASANNGITSLLNTFESGFCGGYMNLKSNSSILLLYERSTCSLFIGILESGNVPAEVSKYIQWICSKNPSMDSKVMSASEENLRECSVRQKERSRQTYMFEKPCSEGKLMGLAWRDL